MGLLLTIEGGEFTGKTSVIIPALKAICEYFSIPCITSREPGGTPAGEEIRTTIFNKLKEGATAHELAILFNQARKIHLEEVIIPFLGEKKEQPRVVLLDRYLDSTRVYQGLEAGVPLDIIKKLENEYVKNFYPDLTLILHFPQEIFARTFNVRQTFAGMEINNRDVTVWDQAEIEKHMMRQNHYLSCEHLAKQWNETRAFSTINAAQHPHEVIKDAAYACLPFFTMIKTELTQLHLQHALGKLHSHNIWEQSDDIYRKQQRIIRDTLMQKVAT